MRVVSQDDIDRVLTFPTLIDALSEAFAGTAEAPVRHHHAIGSAEGARATHLLMPAWSARAPGPASFLGTKIVNVFPENGRLGLPAVLGVYVLQSGETGQPLAVLDGTRLTHWRTAAASALAARHLARPEARHLLVVGAGALAPFLVRAHAAVRPIDRVTVWNHRPAGAEALAGRLRDAGWAATATPDLAAAVAAAEIVSCATLSQSPIVEGSWLQPGQHLDLIGAFNHSMREADDAALQRARIFVDTPAALHEGGDVTLGIASGAITAADVAGDLRGLCRGAIAGRHDADQITLFKSVGTAVEDLAAATLVWRALASS